MTTWKKKTETQESELCQSCHTIALDIASIPLCGCVSVILFEYYPTCEQSSWQYSRGPAELFSPQQELVSVSTVAWPVGFTHGQGNSTHISTSVQSSAGGKTLIPGTWWGLMGLMLFLGAWRLSVILLAHLPTCLRTQASAWTIPDSSPDTEALRFTST